MKKSRILLAIAALGLFLPLTAQAYTFFEDNFESAPAPGPDADDPLLGNGMFVGANVFSSANAWLYGYFDLFPAPNVTGDGARFCNVASDEGGPAQGAKVLSVFSDYNNGGAQTAGDLVDANTYLEFLVEEADLGTTVTFQFDAKYGNLDVIPLGGGFVPEAEAFLKVLNPGNNYAPAVIDVENAAVFPTTWDTYTLTIDIPNEPSWIGWPLQAGFRVKTSEYRDSAIYYDNLLMTSDRVEPEPAGDAIISYEKVGDEFLITFNCTVGNTYDLEKWVDESTGWEFVDFVEAEETTEILTDFDAFGPINLYRIIKIDLP